MSTESDDNGLLRSVLPPERVDQLFDLCGAHGWKLILASAVVMLGSVALPTQSAGNMSSLFFLLSFVIVNVAVIRLRRERPAINRPYKMPFYPAPPLIGIALNLLLTVVLLEYLFRTDPLAIVLSVGWIALGGVAYLGLKRVGTESEPDAETDSTMSSDGEADL